MPAYVWKGKTRDGKAMSGERVADSKEAVMAALRRDQILVSSVKEKGKEVAVPKIGGSVPAKDLAIFTRQFSVMIDAGLPLVQHPLMLMLHYYKMGKISLEKIAEKMSHNVATCRSIVSCNSKASLYDQKNVKTPASKATPKIVTDRPSESRI